LRDPRRLGRIAPAAKTSMVTRTERRNRMGKSLAAEPGVIGTPVPTAVFGPRH
jgi:hypothetical protein